jgi:hypothetical protein
MVKLLKSRPRNVNIDQYLTDIVGLLRSDKRNDFERRRPVPASDRSEVYPMEVQAPDFLEFAKAPTLLANRFVAAWERDSCRYELNGVIASDVSAARLEITTSSDQGSVISVDSFDIVPQRGSFSSAKERHNHLRTLIWEAIELYRQEGSQAVECQLQRVEDGQVAWDDEADKAIVGSSAGSLEFPRQVNGEVVQVCESLGGATVALEVARTQAAISIILPMQNLSTRILMVFESSVQGRSLEPSEVGLLRALAADLASTDESVRRKSREALVEKATAMKVCSEPVRTLYPSFELQESLPVLMSFRPHQRDESYLIDWMLDGYHPAVFTHDYFAPGSQAGVHNFCEMVLGISQSGKIRVQLVHAHQESCGVIVPASDDGDLYLATNRAQAILNVFADHENYTWDSVLEYIHGLVATDGGRLHYERSANGRRLPPLSDKNGIIALANAASVVSACNSASRWVTADSYRMYAGHGSAMAFIRYQDLPVGLSVSFDGERITRLGCYHITEGQSLNQFSVPLLSVEPRAKFGAAQGDSEAIGVLSETFAELLRNPDASRLNTGMISPGFIRDTFQRALIHKRSEKMAEKRS